jgi:hypothetical protein
MSKIANLLIVYITFLLDLSGTYKSFSLTLPGGIAQKKEKLF